MGEDQHIEIQRRQLVQALSLGLLVGGVGWNHAALASWFGKVPRKLPDGRSIFDMKGEVWVNGDAATPETPIHAGDTVTTGADGYAVFAVGDSAMALRGKSTLQTSGRDLLVGGLRLISGGLLAVFGKRHESFNVNTPTATIGIRGTGIYTEVDASMTYFCTCYGTTEIASATDPKDSVIVTSRHHDAGKYILATPDGGRRILPAPFKNHSDIELMTLEALVGSKVPFKMPAGDYDAPRREYPP